MNRRHFGLSMGAALLLACASFIAYDLVTFRQNAVGNLRVQSQIIGDNTVSALVFDDPVFPANPFAR